VLNLSAPIKLPHNNTPIIWNKTEGKVQIVSSGAKSVPNLQNELNKVKIGPARQLRIEYLQVR
jgi:short-subunit dehydrogenase involved in D-alanine esterification of teichoic acids